MAPFVAFIIMSSKSFKRNVAFVLLVLICFSQTIFAKIYECTYKTKSGLKAVSSFNTFNYNHPNYSELSLALRSGDCRELYVKKYFIDATSCNIQFYKNTTKIANMTCAKNNQTALKKLKAIAKKDYGYFR